MIFKFLFEGLIDSLISASSLFFYVMPIGLLVLFLKFWKEYIEALKINSLEWVLLEIKLPKETYKSPKAMEIVLAAFAQSVNPDFHDTYWGGKVGPWFSLEMVSIDGKVHFFIRTEIKYRNTIESHIYSQYPVIEIHEVPDYTLSVPYLREEDKWEMFGTEFELSKEDAYPIKTYIDYGLEKDPVDELYRIEPMAATMEFLGSLTPGEQLWIQIIIMNSKKRFKKKGSWFFGKQDWQDEAKELIDKLKNANKKKEEDELKPGSMALSPGERTILEAVERSVSKIGFDCGIRTLYLAHKDKYEDSRISSLGGAFRQYNTLNLNGFMGKRSTTFSWWDSLTSFEIKEWMKFIPSPSINLRKQKRKMFSAFVDRGYFYPPHDRKPFVLNTEELATIYHFPGQAAEVPSFARIESKKAEPPANLPI